MLTICEDIGMISVLKIATKRLTSADLQPLRAALSHVWGRGRSSLLIDISGVRHVTRSGLAALVELQSGAPQGMRIGFFGATAAVAREFQRCALSALLARFGTRQEALGSPGFRAGQLSGVKAVILCAGEGARMAPMTRSTPKPLLDLVGQPVLDHVMRHLRGYGVRDFILNPGHLAHQFHTQLRSSALRSVQFLNEGYHSDGVWQAAPLGSASTLARLQAQNSAFDDDFFVVCGDAVCDVDLAALMATHKSSGAAVTIAAQTVPDGDVAKYGIITADGNGRITGFVEKPDPAEVASRLASTGIYVVSPSALLRLSDHAGQDIAKDLLPSLLAMGARLQVYDAPFGWVDMGCGSDYFAAVSRALRGLIPGVHPVGTEQRRHVWVAPGAKLSPRAVVVGPCFIGPDAVVEAGAKIDGPTVIGARAFVSTRSLVRRSIVMEDCHVQPGTWVDGMIVSPDWAVDHHYADGSVQAWQRLDGVGPRADPMRTDVSAFQVGTGQ